MRLALSLCCLTLSLAACGSNEQASTPAAPATAPAAAPAVETSAAHPGEAIFKKTCSMCHQTGAAGAPILGDKTDWGPRVAQGNEVLYKHALEGFTGSKGMMPAKGANPALLDDEVKAAVDYMVSKAQ